MRIIIGILSLMLLGCNGCKQGKDQTNVEVPTDMELIERNKQMHLQETKAIKAFIQEKKWPMTETGTGLHYWIYENGTGEMAKTDDIVTISYVVSLLDGEEVYRSDAGSGGSFKIGMDNVESGLHEMLLLMRVGDKAKVVLPSHLAFGLTGDSGKIPQSAPLVYDIQLIGIK